MAGCKIILFFLMNGGQAFRLNFLLGFGSRFTYLDLRSIAVGKQLMNDSQKGMMKEGLKIIFGPKELWQFRLFCFVFWIKLACWNGSINRGALSVLTCMAQDWEPLFWQSPRNEC